MLQSQFGWSGNGSKEDPIIINTSDGFQRRILVKMGALHIHFVSVSIYEIKCAKCSNVVFKECKIYKLTLSRCKGVSVLHNAIMWVVLDISGGNSFQHNRLLGGAYNVVTEDIDHNSAKRKELLRFAVGFTSLSAVLTAYFLYTTDSLLFPGVILCFIFFFIGWITWMVLAHKQGIANKLQSNTVYNNKSEDIRFLDEEIINELSL